MQTWVASTGKIFLVGEDKKDLADAVEEVFEAARTPRMREEAKALLEGSGLSQNPHLN